MTPGRVGVAAAGAFVLALAAVSMQSLAQSTPGTVTCVSAVYDHGVMTCVTATPTPPPTPTPTPTPTNPPPVGTIVWQTGGAGNLTKWIKANSGQCGTPVQTGTSLSFQFTMGQTGCDQYYGANPPTGIRNQAMPLGGTTADGKLNGLTSGVFFLNDGHTYTWTFDYVDSPVGMGPDAQAQSLIFQIHSYGACTGACVCPTISFANSTLPFTPMPSPGTPWGGGTGPQAWALTQCTGGVNGNGWYINAPYTPGETSHWEFIDYMEPNSTGWDKVYRNGQLIASYTGVTRAPNTTYIWWNVGPYKYRWEVLNPPYGGSTMKAVGLTLNNLTLYEK